MRAGSVEPKPGHREIYKSCSASHKEQREDPQSSPSVSVLKNCLEVKGVSWRHFVRTFIFCVHLPPSTGLKGAPSLSDTGGWIQNGSFIWDCGLCVEPERSHLLPKMESTFLLNSNHLWHQI